MHALGGLSVGYINGYNQFSAVSSYVPVLRA